MSFASIIQTGTPDTALAAFGKVNTNFAKLAAIIPVEGADPTGATDSTAAIQAALSAVPSAGAQVYLPAGRYSVTSGTLGCNNPVTFVGAGKSSSSNETGSSQATQSFYQGGTTIFTNATGGDLLTFQSSASQLRDMALQNISATAPTSGTGLNLYNCAGSALTRVKMLGFYNNAHFLNGYLWTVTDSDFYLAVNAGMLVEDQALHDGGDQSVMGCNFGGYVTTSRVGVAGILIKSGGGMKVVNSKFNQGWQYGVLLAVGAGVQTSDLLIANNSIENVTASAIQLQTDDNTGSYANVIVQGNQVTLCPNGLVVGAGVNTVTAGGNQFNVTGVAIGLNGGVGHKIFPNLINGQISIGGGSDFEVQPQSYPAAGTAPLITDTTSGASQGAGSTGLVRYKNKRALPTTIAAAGTILATFIVPAYAAGTVRVQVNALLNNVGSFIGVIERGYTIDGNGGTQTNFVTIGTDVSHGAAAGDLTLSISDSGNGNLHVYLQNSTANTVAGFMGIEVDGPVYNYQLT